MEKRAVRPSSRRLLPFQEFRFRGRPLIPNLIPQRHANEITVQYTIFSMDLLRASPAPLPAKSSSTPPTSFLLEQYSVLSSTVEQRSLDSLPGSTQSTNESAQQRYSSEKVGNLHRHNLLYDEESMNLLTQRPPTLHRCDRLLIRFSKQTRESSV